MALVSIEEMTLQYGSKQIFDGASLAIEKGDRLGIVGPNGTGKSTLLKILSGQVEPDGGRIILGKDVRVGYLAQEHADPGQGNLLSTLLEAVPGRDDVECRITAIEQKFTQTTDEHLQMSLSQDLSDLHDQLAKIEDQFAAHRAKTILGGLGFKNDDFEKPLSEFSGGWRMRAALASLLFQDPDVLLLDEPTNHLDMPTVAWLDAFLASFRKSVVLTCHDREFLNRNINRVASLELDGLKIFKGNYDEYLVQRELELEHLEAKARTSEKKKKELEAFVTRFKAKATKARQAQSKAKLIEKLEDEQVDLPQIRRAVTISFAPVERCGAVALSVDKLHFSYPGLELFKDLNLEVRRGDRIAIVGVNGAGKTTLLKLICGELDAQDGEIKLGHNVVPSYFAQHQAEVLDSSRSVLDEVASSSKELTSSRARALCGAFLFSGDDVEKPIGVLSGGEKTRVALARMLADPGNMLLLDEPTNHLDTESADKLTESLRGYDGTLLFISHNLDFARRLSNKVWNVSRGSVEIYPGSLGDYLDHLALVAAEKNQQADASSVSTSESLAGLDKDARKKARAEERKERSKRAKKKRSLEELVVQLESEIAVLEEKQSSYESQLAAPTDDYEKMSELAAEYEATKASLEDRVLQWTETLEQVEQMQKEDES